MPFEFGDRATNIVALLRVIQGRRALEPGRRPEGRHEMKNVGIALVVLGVVGLIVGGFGFDRQRTVLEVGGLKATATEHTTIPYAPILGAISLIGGIVLLVGAKRQGTGLS